jgi:predicted porin
MHKKILVGAVAAAVSIPGMALAATQFGSGDNVVELYGRVYPEVISPHGSGATDAGAPVATFAGTPTGENGIIRRTEMSSSNSRLGVRGHERLGGDLKAIFQLETEFHVDSNDSAFAQRNSFVGLEGKRWGTIKLGRMDTPFKTYGDDISFLGVGSGNFVSSSNVLRKTGFGTNSASSFHLRRQNAVQYESPTWGGFDFTVQYSTNEADTNTRKARVWSLGTEYERGPLKVSLSHEEHWDLFGLSRNVPSSMSNFNDQAVNSKDKATQAMIEYKINKVHKIEADWIRKEYNENATVVGRASSYKNNAYEVIWSARWSKAWRTDIEYIKSFKGSCTRVATACNTDGLDGSQFQAGFAYYFAPRTYLFAMAAFLRNGFSARYNNEDLQDVSVGEDITQWAVGLSHSF